MSETSAFCASVRVLNSCPLERSAQHRSPRRGPPRDFLSPPAPLPAPSPGRRRARSPVARVEEPLEDGQREPDDGQQPELQRTTQILPVTTQAPDGTELATFSSKAELRLSGDLNQMAMGWSNEEWTNRRRLIQFWRQQEGNVINASFRPISQAEYMPNTIVISCIFRDEWNECFVTSVDTIYLLESLVGMRFPVEEKNRIRRNLEGYKPLTVSKTKSDSEPFFKLIMGFPNPKPRNIEKDVKVFRWKVLSEALHKIISKYVSVAVAFDDIEDWTDGARQSATYIAPADAIPPEAQVPAGSEDGEATARDSAVEPSRGDDRHAGRAHSPPTASPRVGSRSQLTSPQIPQEETSARTLRSRSSRRTTRSSMPPSRNSGRAGSLPPSSPTADEANAANADDPADREDVGSRRRMLPPSLPFELPPVLPRSGHSRPGSFDFNAILDSSSFAGDLHRHHGRRSIAHDFGPPGDGSYTMPTYPPSSETLFPPSLDGAAASDDPSGAPLNHSRSWSEGRRRSIVPGAASPYAYATEYYAQDLAGPNGSWAGGFDSSGAAGQLAPPPTLRRSISMEGVRVQPLPTSHDGHRAHGEPTVLES